MIIEIKEEQKEKLGKCAIELARHALATLRTRKEVAAYLGITTRSLNNWINRHDELASFKKKNEGGNEKWRRLANEVGWKINRY